VLSSAQFYRRGKRQCDDLFPQKKVPFCFINPHDPDAGSRGQKVGSLKILKSAASSRRNRCAMDKSYQLVRHAHLPEVKKESFCISAQSCYQ
jgi:hypothetical protein